MTTALPAYPTFQANDDFKVFTERLQNAFFINKTSPTDRAPILLNQIDAGVYKTLRSLCDPEPPANKSFEDLCALLRRQYVRELSIWKARQQFFWAFQAQNERVNNWYLRLKELAADCGFGETLDAAIRCKFVAGLESSVAFDKIAEQGSTLTMDELLAIVMSMEDEPQKKRNPNPRNRRRRKKSVENTLNETNEEKLIACDTNQNESQSNQNQSQSNQIQIQSNERGNQGPFRQCWHCGEAGGHKFSTCVHKTSYCNFCHELGHLETVCRHVRPEVRSEIDEKLIKVVDGTKVAKQPPPEPIPEELKLCPQCKFFGKIFALFPDKPCSACGYIGHMINAFPSKKHEPEFIAARQRSVVVPLDISSAQPPLTANVRPAQQTPALNVRPSQATPVPVVRPVQQTPTPVLIVRAVQQTPVLNVRPPQATPVPVVCPVQQTPTLNVRPPQAAPAPIIRSAQTSALGQIMRNCPYCGGTNHSFDTCEARPCRICFKIGHLSHQCDLPVIENQPRQQQNSKKKDDKCCIC